MRKVVRKIKALQDMELKTIFEDHFLSKGEVKTIRFKDIQTFKAHLKLGNFVEAAPGEEESKTIPVIYPIVESFDEEKDNGKNNHNTN